MIPVLQMWELRGYLCNLPKIIQPATVGTSMRAASSALGSTAATVQDRSRLALQETRFPNTVSQTSKCCSGCGPDSFVASWENIGLVSQFPLRTTLVPTCKAKHQICEAEAAEGSGRIRQGLPFLFGGSDFGPSLSQGGGEASSMPLGTGRGSSSKDKRETSPREGERVGS